MFGTSVRYPSSRVRSDDIIDARKVIMRDTTSTTLRLTARGRRFFTGLAFVPAAILIALAGINAAPADAMGAAPSVSSLPSVTVQSGESLWTIAEEHAAGRDVRDVVDDIIRVNALRTHAVEPGQRLLLPNS